MEGLIHHKKTVRPPYGDIAEEAQYLVSRGEPIIVLVDIVREVFEQGKKPGIVRLLQNYGTIIDNPDYSPLVALMPHNLDSLRKLQDDHHKDKLPGVRVLELDRKDVTYDGLTLNDYL